MSETEVLTRKYLSSVNLMQIATYGDGKPWCSSLYYAIDEDLNMYWISLPETRHSKNIDNNNSVAVAVAAEFEYGKPIAGLSIEGVAEHLTDLVKQKALLEMYKKQMNRDDKFVEDMISGEDPHHMYVFRPQHFKLFDRISFPKGAEEREWSIDANN